MTKDDFKKIFYSNSLLNVDWFNLEEITLMYEENLIGFNKIFLGNSNKFDQALGIVQDPTQGLINGGESQQHIALKFLIRQFLSNKYKFKIDDFYIEYPFLGFEVDLIDKNFRFPSECGDTNALKLEKYLSPPTVEKFFVLPYPHMDDIYTFEFFAQPDFIKYIEFKKDYFNKKNSKLR
ncbi:hypothetical protein HYS97_03705 [Candidatus Daviesbacteria bacterium]|nr:hypothetical protein [Candidatus Daviesbacteria bacterium]